jgi:hypothetical protein
MRGSKYGGDHGSEVALKINVVLLLKHQLKNRVKQENAVSWLLDLL